MHTRQCCDSSLLDILGFIIVKWTRIFLVCKLSNFCLSTQTMPALMNIFFVNPVHTNTGVTRQLCFCCDAPGSYQHLLRMVPKGSGIVSILASETSHHKKQKMVKTMINNAAVGPWGKQCWILTTELKATASSQLSSPWQALEVNVHKSRARQVVKRAEKERASTRERKLSEAKK